MAPGRWRSAEDGACFVPKPVQLARLAIKDKGIDLAGLTGDDLKNALTTKELNSLCCTFRNKLGPEAKADYQHLTADEDRRKWVAQFVIDPNCCTKEGYNRNAAWIQETKRVKEHWLTQTQLASSQWLNSEEQAEALCQSGNLESRPHEYPALAAKGILQYRYMFAEGEKEQGNRQEAGTSASTALSSSEYQQVSDDMVKPIAKATKRKVTTVKEPESEDAKKLKVSKSMKASQLRKFKQIIDTAASQAALSEEEAQKISSKGYPQAMTDFCLQKVQEFKDIIDISKKAYADLVTTEWGAQTTSIDLIEKSLKELDGHIKDLNQQLKKFKEGVFTDVKKLVS